MDKEARQLYEMKAEIINAAASPLRLAIIEFLADGEQCVCDIVQHLGAQRSNVSRHLSVMVNAGVLASRKEGLKVFYWLKTPCIVDFLGCVEKVLKERIKDQSHLLEKLG